MAGFSIWGNMGNQAYAMPMVKLTPVDPENFNQLLGWNINEQGLDFLPLQVDPTTGDVDFSGNVFLTTGKTYSIGGQQVVGARRIGWVPATGTSTRSTFDTATVTTAQLAERVKALLDDLTTHGLIGA